MAGTPSPNNSQEFLGEYNGKQAVFCAILFIALEVLFLSLRYVARRLKKVAWGWDDFFMMGAALFSYALIAACLCDVYAGGVGHHLPYVKLNSPGKLGTWAKFTIIIPLMYLPAVTFPKLSIVALYLRIFSDRIPRIVCWVTGGLIITNCVGSMIPAFVACVPLEYLWDHTLPGGGRCISFNAWYRWSSLVNIVTDIVILVLPLPTIFKLHASVGMRIGLAITFATGSIGVITAVVRFVGFFTQDMANDGTWTATRLIILSIMEPGLYLIAACLVGLKPLLVWVWNRTPLSSLRPNRSVAEESRKDNYQVINLEEHVV